jgi:hypothetical protein
MIGGCGRKRSVARLEPWDANIMRCERGPATRRTGPMPHHAHTASGTGSHGSIYHRMHPSQLPSPPVKCLRRAISHTQSAQSAQHSASRVESGSAAACHSSVQPGVLLRCHTCDEYAILQLLHLQSLPLHSPCQSIINIRNALLAPRRAGRVTATTSGARVPVHVHSNCSATRAAA